MRIQRTDSDSDPARGDGLLAELATVGDVFPAEHLALLQLELWPREPPGISFPLAFSIDCGFPDPGDPDGFV